jgi:hypothetical protein
MAEQSGACEVCGADPIPYGIARCPACNSPLRWGSAKKSTAEKFISAGEKMQKAGGSMAKAGNTMTCGCLSLIIVVVAIFIIYVVATSH